jgi:ribosome-associated toxin RatA of RatAB toxin-antitoxin module
MRSSIAIDVFAPAQTVFDLARNVEGWPAMLPHYRSVTVRSRDDGELTADMRATRSFGRLPVHVGWRSRTWSEPGNGDDLRLRFVHVAGPTRGMDVTWHIRPAGQSACSATIVHDFTRPLPLIGGELFPHIVDRLFVRPIAGETLRTFKSLAERATKSGSPA